MTAETPGLGFLNDESAGKYIRSSMLLGFYIREIKVGGIPNFMSSPTFRRYPSLSAVASFPGPSLWCFSVPWLELLTLQAVLMACAAPAALASAALRCLHCAASSGRPSLL